MPKFLAIEGGISSWRSQSACIDCLSSLLVRQICQYCFAGCRLSSFVTLPDVRRERGKLETRRGNASRGRVGLAGCRARGWSGGRHCTAGQSCFVPLVRHLV